MESVNIKELNDRIQQESSFVDLLSIEMGKVIVGQKHLVENLLIGLLANGHILEDGTPRQVFENPQHSRTKEFLHKSYLQEGPEFVI